MNLSNFCVGGTEINAFIGSKWYYWFKAVFRWCQDKVKSTIRSYRKSIVLHMVMRISRAFRATTWYTVLVYGRMEWYSEKEYKYYNHLPAPLDPNGKFVEYGASCQ